MPVVPTLSNNQVAIRPETPVRQRNVSALAEGLGAAAQGLAAVGERFEQERVRALNVELNALDVRARDARERLLYDPNDGILTRRGRAAFDADEEAARRWMAEMASIEADARDPELRQAFRQRAERIGSDIRSMALRHAAGEVEAVDAETTKALVGDELDVVARVPRDLQRVQTALANAERLTRDRMERMGMPIEAIDRAVQEMRSGARMQQIDALVRAGDVQTARAVLDENRDALTPKALEDATKVVQGAEMGMAVQQEAVRILAATDSPTERNALIAELPIGMRRGVRDLVQAEQKAASDARKQEQEDAFAAVEQAVINGTPLSNPSLAPNLARLTTTQRQTLERYAQAPTNDNAAWLEFYQLSLEPNNLARMSESEFRSHWSRLATNHRDDAERLYREAKQTANGPQSSRAYITPQTIIARAMRNLGGIAPFAPLSQIDEKKQPMVAQFEMRASEEIAAERNAKGRDLTPSEVQGVVDRMQMTFIRETARTPISLGDRLVRGRQTREELRAFEMSPADTTGIFAGTTRIRLDAIPSEALSGVDNILRANRIPLTDANREAIYTIQQFDTDGSRLTRWLNDNRR